MSIDIKNDTPLNGVSNSYHMTWCEPDEDFYEIRLGNTYVRFGKSVYEKLLSHTVLTKHRGEMFDTLIIDEFASLSEEQVEHLVSLGANIISNGKADKKPKVKHKIPYWANDYRRKK